MNALEKVIVAVLTLCVVLVITPICGGIAGWVFAFVFQDSFATLKGILRIEATGFQVGAALGFLGAFFKATCNK